MNIIVDKKKALKKWSPILESLGVTDNTAQDWMSEYAEYHSINENTAYSTLGNLSGMGGVQSPQPSGIAGDAGSGLFNPVAGAQFGQGGVAGSGDYGQQLLPVAMKVAAQTIGLDLVAVKPSPGPVIDLMFIDYRYDDRDRDPDYNPVVFKIDADDLTPLLAEIDIALAASGANLTQGGVNKAVFLPFGENTLTAEPSYNPEMPSSGFGNAVRAAGVVAPNYTSVADPANVVGAIEFLGYSRIDKKPMFRAFRQTNAAATGAHWVFDQRKNTFGQGEAIVEAFENSAVAPAGTAGGQTIGGLTGVSVELVSALEDHLPGFSAGFHRKGAMSRKDDENTYPGVIAPNVSTKRVQVGTVEVSSALKRTEIEDIKSQTGIDIVSKLESVLINELSQTISKEIVYKVFELGESNRATAPLNTGALSNGGTVFDFDVDSYFASAAAAGNAVAPGGETTNSAQRKLLTRIDAASNYIATEGRIGPAQYIVTNAKLGAVLKTASGYTINPIKSALNPAGQLYPMGAIGDLTIYVDPYMLYNDDRIVMGRKNNPDQPGLIFVPYLMAQSISLISEATFAPRMLLRSRYAITDVGFFPQKQYMAIHVTDTNGYLS
jgi:hypothetical protein